jgi:hypothetical protein
MRCEVLSAGCVMQTITNVSKLVAASIFSLEEKMQTADSSEKFITI